MRIIAGTWRGRALSTPGPATRPTADRVRQAVFDRLMHAPWAAPIRDATVLDAYAGTGALGLEALSRGAAHAVFMERDRAALHVLRANIAACRAEAQCTVLAADVLRPPPGRPCGLVFLDPPYVPISDHADFKRYTRAQFHLPDHVAMAQLVAGLAERGCEVVVTNSNHHLVRDLYKNYAMTTVPTRRNVNARGDGRRGEDMIIHVRPA